MQTVEACGDIIILYRTTLTGVDHQGRKAWKLVELNHDYLDDDDDDDVMIVASPFLSVMVQFMTCWF